MLTCSVFARAREGQFEGTTTGEQIASLKDKLEKAKIETKTAKEASNKMSEQVKELRHDLKDVKRQFRSWRGKHKDHDLTRKFKKYTDEGFKSLNQSGANCSLSTSGVSKKVPNKLRPTTQALD